jgi:hypothetical protein
MTFNPKFSSYRSRIVALAFLASLDAVFFLRYHVASKLALVLLAVIAIMSAVIPESTGKVKVEKYRVT